MQASLLLSYLTQEKPLHLQATALKCLHYVIVKGMGHFPASSNSITTLVSMLDESEFPQALQCGALQILRKVILALCRFSCKHTAKLVFLFTVHFCRSSYITYLLSIVPTYLSFQGF